MTEKQKKLLAESPVEFLKSCWYHNQWIKLKLEEIRHYRDIAESITAEIKEVTTFGLTPSCKVENCVVEIVSIQEMLQARVKELRSDLDAVQEAINLLEDETQILLMDARYIRHMKWEEIAILLSYTHRRTLQIHSKALKEISKRIISL
jgi:DNA-directed RNA polymerase specialized sigma subunit